MLLNELQILHDLSHPNIMGVKQLLKDKKNYYIISEIISGGELYELINKEKYFEEVRVAQIMK